jgi:hypothetical protein
VTYWQSINEPDAPLELFETVVAAATRVSRKKSEGTMPEKKTLQRTAEDKAERKSPGAQAGEFVREEVEPVREGKHGARSAKQAGRNRSIQSASGRSKTPWTKNRPGL